MIITTVVSVACLGFKLTVAFVCGATVCLIAMYIYNESAGSLLSGGEAAYYDSVGTVRAADSRHTFRLAPVDAALYQTAGEGGGGGRTGEGDCAAGAEVEMSTIQLPQSYADDDDNDDDGEDESV